MLAELVSLLFLSQFPQVPNTFSGLPLIPGQTTSSPCRLDSALHGIYKKQSTSLRNLVFDNALRDSQVFDDVTITATSISEYGECYTKSADAFIFVLKRMGRAPCFRCITPIIKTANVIQLAHQQEDVCHEKAEEARATCFDTNSVSMIDGYLLFRSENAETASCEVSGRFSIGYQLRGGNLSCSLDGGSTASNCDDSPSLLFQFKNCTFPEFDMSLRCIGSWKEADGRQLAIFQNEESGDYRCGTFEKDPSSPEIEKIHLANDSTCGRLSPISAYETYSLKSEGVSDSSTSVCVFPEWLRGAYDSLTISANVLRYEGPGMAPVLSRCVHVDGERILVHSRTKCGEELGYHCLWFRARSDNLIEFKTTTPSSDKNSSDESICSEVGELSSAIWNAALIKQPNPVGCGIKGHYTTPIELKSRDCYNVSVDCSRSDSLRLAAFDCKSGVVYDSRSYSCVASWRDEDHLFIYSTRARDTHSCFVLRYEGGRLFFSSTGAHCKRGFNFTENADKTIILQENGQPQIRRKAEMVSGGCASPTLPPTIILPIKPKSPARRPMQIQYRPPIPTVIATSTSEIPTPEPMTDSAEILKENCIFISILFVYLMGIL